MLSTKLVNEVGYWVFNQLKRLMKSVIKIKIKISVIKISVIKISSAV